MNLKSHLFIYFCLFFKTVIANDDTSYICAALQSMKPIMLQRWDSSQTESKQSVTFVASGWHTLLFFAGLHVTKGNPHSGILVKSRILDFVIWNVAQGIRNPANNWNPKSNLNRKWIRNPLLWMRNAWRGILNPRLSWILLHEANIIADIWPKRRRN